MSASNIPDFSVSESRPTSHFEEKPSPGIGAAAKVENAFRQRLKAHLSAPPFVPESEVPALFERAKPNLSPLVIPKEKGVRLTRWMRVWGQSSIPRMTQERWDIHTGRITKGGEKINSDPIRDLRQEVIDRRAKIRANVGRADPNNQPPAWPSATKPNEVSAAAALLSAGILASENAPVNYVPLPTL